MSAAARIVRGTSWPRLVSVAALLLATGTFAPPVAASDAPISLGSAAGHSSPGFTWSIGVLGGWAQPDARLADYQWRTHVSAGWGLKVVAGTGRFSGGLRNWNTIAEQKIGASDAPDAASVRGTSWEAIGRGRLARAFGQELLVTASAGRLHLEYEPGRVTINESGTPIVVELKAIDEWIGGAGLALERRVLGTWKVGIEVERRFFGLDTAHRDGESIAERRETTGDWNARVELARLVASR